MNYTTEQRRKLWGILASLAAAVTIAVVLDTLPLNPPTTDVLDGAGETSSTADTTPPDSAPDTTTSSPDAPADSEPVETTPVTPPQDTSFVLTFLGECAPGSPLGTNSFGSLNALAEEAGYEYFFSELKSFLSCMSVMFKVDASLSAIF